MKEETKLKRWCEILDVRCPYGTHLLLSDATLEEKYP
jgi:hypothetical protein